MSRRWIGLFFLLAACGNEPGDGGGPEPTPTPVPVLAAAHYYTWYDELRHWSTQGVYREPYLGRYRSEDPRTAAQHVAWSRAAGIDVLAVEWAGPDYAEQYLRDGLLKAPNLGQIRWCLFYDTDIRLQSFGYKDPTRMDFDDGFVRRTVAGDIVRLAREFFGHPQYFRIHGRPVIWLYLTRSYVGQWEATLDEVRRRTAEMGQPVYLIADEVWHVDPQPARLPSFDAVSTYNIYNPPQMRQRASWTLTEYAALYSPVFERWRSLVPQAQNRAHGRPVTFMPAVAPQFDDSRARPGLNPPVVAESRRQVVEVFTQAREMAALNAEPQERIVWITSFNEWHEGTSIEPTIEAGPPLPRGNYGFELLKAVSEVFGGTMHLQQAPQ